MLYPRFKQSCRRQPVVLMCIYFVTGCVIGSEIYRRPGSIIEGGNQLAMMCRH